MPGLSGKSRGFLLVNVGLVGLAVGTGWLAAGLVGARLSLSSGHGSAYASVLGDSLHIATENLGAVCTGGTSRPEVAPQKAVIVH